VELTAQDEARHVSYGLIYMQDELPRMNEADRDRIEDFAWTAVDLVGGRQAGAAAGEPLLQILDEIGVDTAAAVTEMQEKFSDPKTLASRPNPVRDYVVPNLRRIGLVTDRTASNYRELGMEV
jgi:hypothetical protein